jgi:hypothetical protein
VAQLDHQHASNIGGIDRVGDGGRKHDYAPHSGRPATTPMI